MKQDANPYQALSRVDDAWFRSIGLFGEVNHPLGERDRIVAGLRTDAWEASDERQVLRVGTAMAPPTPRPTTRGGRPCQAALRDSSTTLPAGPPRCSSASGPCNASPTTGNSCPPARRACPA